MNTLTTLSHVKLFHNLKKGKDNTWHESFLEPLTYNAAVWHKTL